MQCAPPSADAHLAWVSISEASQHVQQHGSGSVLIDKVLVSEHAPVTLEDYDHLSSPLLWDFPCEKPQHCPQSAEQGRNIQDPLLYGC